MNHDQVSPGQHETATDYLTSRLSLAFPVLEKERNALDKVRPFKKAYVNYLLALHGTIRASVPLMEAAQLSCRRQMPDPVLEILDTYLTEHIHEELGHDGWVLADLAALGVTNDVAVHQLPLPAVAKITGPMYYWINHVDPVAELGYIFCLERYVTTSTLIDRWQRLGNLPEDCLTCLRRHAELDGEHSDDVCDLLNGLPLTDRQLRLLAVVAMGTATGMARLFAELRQVSMSPSKLLA